MSEPKLVERSAARNKPRWRIEFDSEKEALTHRRTYGTGGWVLGRFLYPGTSWTPSEVMLDCPDSGQLK